MLEGITVLNQAEIMVTPNWFNVVFFIATLLAVIFILVGIFNIDEAWGQVLATTALVMFAVLMITSWFEPGVKIPSGRYKYECLIDESVSMTDVYERYEIIEQRGDIWVLEDKK